MNHSNYTYSSTGIQQMLINNEQTVDFADMNENKTLYANPYMVLNDREYTKHYYTEGQRIASKIGGGLAPSIVHYNQQITPITEDTYAVLSDRLLKRCQLSDGCVGFNGEYTNYGKTIKCVKPLVEMDEPEKDVYFYHSDHIGSSSFITDRNGYASQHLQYLPFGELFVEQRSTANYYTPYKFSGKEKDEETSYSYFGARYYMSDVSVWLSVDPMRDDYPYQSPYTYCGWSPVMLIDPDGQSEGNPDVFIVGNQAQDAFNDLQSKSNLPLIFNNTTGQVTVGEITPITKDPFTGALVGDFLSEDDLQLLDAINNPNVTAELDASSYYDTPGEFHGTAFNIKYKNGVFSVKVTSYNHINLDKVHANEKDNGVSKGTNILHEITEGYEAGKISLKIRKKLDPAYVYISTTTITDRNGNPKVISGKSYGKDHPWYNIAHNKATLDPNDSDHPKYKKK